VAGLVCGFLIGRANARDVLRVGSAELAFGRDDAGPVICGLAARLRLAEATSGAEAQTGGRCGDGKPGPPTLYAMTDPFGSAHPPKNFGMRAI